MTNTTTERRLAITPGEAKNELWPDGSCEMIVGNRLVASCGHSSVFRDENRANFTLQADAHNTYNACGMLPSELWAKLREAEAKLEDIAEQQAGADI